MAVAAIGAVVLLTAAGLAWTARLVHVSNLDALELASKVGVPHPVSALDWPELRVRAIVPQPGDQALVLLLVGWPAHPQRAATVHQGVVLAVRQPFHPIPTLNVIGDDHDFQVAG